MRNVIGAFILAVAIGGCAKHAQRDDDYTPPPDDVAAGLPSLRSSQDLAIMRASVKIERDKLELECAELLNTVEPPQAVATSVLLIKSEVQLMGRSNFIRVLLLAQFDLEHKAMVKMGSLEADSSRMAADFLDTYIDSYLYGGADFSDRLAQTPRQQVLKLCSSLVLAGAR